MNIINKFNLRKEILKGLEYAGYYDEQKNFYIDINESNAKKLIKRITGANEVNII